MTEKEYNLIFKDYNKSLVWFARGFIGDLYCEDIVADVFLALFELNKEEHFNIKSFLYTSVRTRCLNLLKSKYNRYRVSDEGIENHLFSDEYADGRMMKAELLRIVTDKRESLPPVRRKIFDLLYLNQLPVNEIAIVMNIDINTVRVQKSRIDKEFRIFDIQLFPQRCWVVPQGGHSKKPLLANRCRK